MGMVEADDVFAALAAFTLDADKFLGIDVVAVVGGVGAGVAGAGDGGDDAGGLPALQASGAGVFADGDHYAVADLRVFLGPLA